MKNKKYEDARVVKKDSSDILAELFGDCYAKSPLLKNFKNYKENLQCIKDVTDRLLDCMKGYRISYRPEITDWKGKFSEKKLSDFVEKLLTIWADKQREGTYQNPATGESLAEPYIRKRKELYSCFLYLIMRCSLEKGAYTLVKGTELEERTNFAFLLEQAKMLMNAWCVMAYPEGKKNELFYGYDDIFGLHLYAPVMGLYKGYDVGFDRISRLLPMERPAFLTDEGNLKQNALKAIYCGRVPESLTEQKKTDEENAFEEELKNEDGYDVTEDEKGFDNESDYMAEDIEENDEYFEYDYEFDDGLADFTSISGWSTEEEYDYKASRVQEQLDREILVNDFECQVEYIKKCERFVKLFRQAEAEVLHDFCEDLEEIVTLYLIERGISPMMDTDKVMNVYGIIYDNALQQAESYERRKIWKTIR